MSRRLTSSLTALALAISATGCANYDFAKARNDDGSWNITQLVEDLEASEDDSLIDGIWIPLIYMDATVFSPDDDMIPGGYTLGQIESFGPLFLGGSAAVANYNSDQVAVEQMNGWWALWGIGAHARDHRIQTISGERLKDSWGALLVLNSDDVVYERDPDNNQ